MIAAGILALAVAVAIGCLAVRCLWPEGSPGMMLCVGIPLGLALTAAWPNLSPWLDLAALAALALAAWPRLKQPVPFARAACGERSGTEGAKQPVPFARQALEPVTRWRQAVTPVPLGAAILGAAFGVAAVVALVVAGRAGRAEVWGSWDGWAIWNLHARVLYRAPETWARWLRDPAVAWTHPDYPLIVPAAVARLWRWCGSETPWAPAALGLLWGAATVGLLILGLEARRAKRTGYFAGLCLLGTPAFVLVAPNSHADLPLACHLLAGLVLILEAERFPGGGLAVLAGALVGFEAGVKNEGWLMLMNLALLAWFTLGRRRSGFFLGAAAAAAPTLWFKLRVAPPNDLVAAAPWSRLRELIDWHRHSLIAKAVQRDIMAFGDWRRPGLYLLALGTVCVSAAAWRLQKKALPLTRAERGVGLVLLGIAAGDWVVYSLSPYDLDWHLRNSLVRLISQIWPSGLLLLGLVAGGAPGPVGGARIGARWVAVLSVAGSLAALAFLMRQPQGDEFAVGWTRRGRVSIVLEQGWYGPERLRGRRWAWSSGVATLRVEVPSGSGAPQLRFGLRSLSLRRVVISDAGRELWTGEVGTALRRVELPGLAGAGTHRLRFVSDRAGEREGPNADARSLSFAICDPSLR